MEHKELQLKVRIPWPAFRSSSRSTSWLPNRGNVIFTLAMIALLVITQSAGALPLRRPQWGAPTSTSTGA